MAQRGITLIELVATILVLGIAVHLTVAPFRRQVDAIVLNAAREEVVALFHRARTEARMSGRSALRIVEGRDPMLIAGDRPPVRANLGNRGVQLEIAGARGELEVAYGALGMASVASATLILRRRGTETQLVISSYGRIRR